MSVMSGQQKKGEGEVRKLCAEGFIAYANFRRRHDA